MSIAALESIAPLLADIALTHGHEPSNVSGFPGPGTWLIFAVILMPIYVMVAAWFLGAPRDVKTALLGVGYLVGITTALWVGMFVQMEIIGIVFY